MKKITLFLITFFSFALFATTDSFSQKFPKHEQHLKKHKKKPTQALKAMHLNLDNTKIGKIAENVFKETIDVSDETAKKLGSAYTSYAKKLKEEKESAKGKTEEQKKEAMKKLRTEKENAIVDVLSKEEVKKYIEKKRYITSEIVRRSSTTK